MIEAASVLFLTAESPIHAGAGGVDGVIDLPIQRSVQTTWPILNDSTLRGGLRRAFDPSTADDLFGRESGGDDSHPGWLSTPDAEILAFPVASAAGVVAYVTCMSALHALGRTLAMFDSYLGDAQASARELTGRLAGLTRLSGEDCMWLPKASAIPWSRNGTRTAVLEPYAFREEGTHLAEALAEWLATNAWCPGGDSKYWKTWFKDRFVIVHDDAFTQFVKAKTDIRTRNSVSAGRAADNLWTEENLPADSLLFTVVAADNWKGAGARDEAVSKLTTLQDALTPKSKVAGTSAAGAVIQLGGDQNLGRGQLRLRQLGPPAPASGHEQAVGAGNEKGGR